MKQILSVWVLGLLVASLAQAYPAGERAGGDLDGSTACPVVGKPAMQSALQRVAPEPLQPQHPMSPAASSCGHPTDLLAQAPMGTVCRYGYLWCRLTDPPQLPIGAPCCCYAGFCGTVTYN